VLRRGSEQEGKIMDEKVVPGSFCKLNNKRMQFHSKENIKMTDLDPDLTKNRLKLK
jgi:hypothetical protein